MTLPTIHMNGTPPERLREAAEVAYGKVGEAIEALVQMSPNARDYYPQREGSFHAAVEQHQQYLQNLQAIRSDLKTYAEHIDVAIEARKRQRAA